MSSMRTHRTTLAQWHKCAAATGGRAPDVIPVIRYRDARAALDWLERAFGFETHSVHEDAGTVRHAEMRWRGGMVMLGSGAPLDPSDNSRSMEGVYVIVEDVDAHCARARAAGAEIVLEPTDQDYGSRDYQARDPEGHLWSFGTYRPN